ncbi:MAG: AAA family ATPase [Phycisphaerae bacterium]
MKSALQPRFVAHTTHPPVPVDWLWPARLPVGKLSLLVGHPGVGKSIFATYLAATISKGRDWPDATMPMVRLACGNHEIQPHLGTATYITAEESPTDTVYPRLIALDAQLSYTHVIDGVYPIYNFDDVRSFSLTACLEALEQAIYTALRPRLVILDTLTSLLVHDHDFDPVDTPTRRSLPAVAARLARLAAKHNVAILALAHLCKKAGQERVLRARVAMPFIAAARCVLSLSADPIDPTVRILTCVKNTLAPLPPPLAFRINPGPAIDWLPARPSAPVYDELAESRQPIIDAIHWLRTELANGPRPSRDLHREARAAGFSPSTVRRAKLLIGVRAAKPSNEQPWVWSLPPEALDVEKSSDNQGGQREGGA